MTNTKPQTGCDAIREVIRRAGRPVKMAEIIAGLPPEHRKIASQQVCIMARSGLLLRRGDRRLDYTYEIGRAPKVRRCVNDEAYREAQRAKWRKWAASQRARRKAGLLPPKRKPAPQAARKAPAPPRPKPVKTPRPLVRESLPSSAPPEPVRRQTVAEFLTAGGAIERIPLHAVSKPLLRIGAKASQS